MCMLENHQRNSVSLGGHRGENSLFWQRMEKYLMFVYVHMRASGARRKMRTGRQGGNEEDGVKM